MAELNKLTINGNNYTFEDDVARGLATTEASRAQAAEQSLQTAINGKVDKVAGKGLSTNDYTNDEKAKLAELENYDDTQVRQLIAQTNANFANYYTKTESYSATEVDTLLRTQRQGQFVVVNTLPTPSADTMFKIYLVPSTNPETQNVKDEFVTLESNGTYSWEQIGTTAVDLSGYSTTEEMNAAIANALTSYYTKSEVDEALGGKQNTIDDLANIRSGAQAGSTAVQPSTLNNVVKNMVAESCVYDVSANNDNTKFESLSALLSSANLNTLIPTDIRKGGMSIKFVLSSDNKYVQYRLMADEWSTNTDDWAIYSESVYVENPEYVYVKTDSEGKVLWGIKKDGSIYYGAGVPKQVVDYINEKIAELSLDEYEDIVTFLGELINGDKTLAELLSEIDAALVTKVDKVEGKGLSTNDYTNEDKGVVDTTQLIENQEWLKAITDSEDRILFGIKKDGSTYIADSDIIAQADAKIQIAIAEMNAALEETEADVDAKIAAFEEKFSFLDVIDDVENRREILIDSEDRVVSYRDKDGVLRENVGIETPQLNANKVNTPVVNTEKIEGLSTEGLNELESALKANGFDRGYSDWSDYISNDGKNPLAIPMPRCAIVNITNDNGNAVWPTSKTANYEYYLEFWDMQGNYFKKPVIYNAQGNSSLSMPKKNGGFDMFDSEWDGDVFSIKFGNWVPQDSFHLKAYYADYFVGVGAIGYKLFNQITNTRDVFTNRDWKKALLPSKATIGVDCRALADFDDKYSLDNDARCFPDGFPCIVYLNGTFYGVYSWQLKKHRDNYMMSKKKPLHIHLDGVIDSAKLFGANGDSSLIGWVDVNDTGFEIRNPKPKKKKDGWDLTCIDGTKYDADTNMQEIIGEDNPLYDSSNTSHINTNKTKKAILQLSTYITELEEMEANEATDAEIRERLSEMFDIESFVDYLIFSDIVCNYDGFRKNWQWITWDGDKWYVEPYDLDGIFGWSGWGQVDYNGNRYGNDKTIPSGWIIQYYQTELEARYAELRESGILTTDNILKIFREWIAAIGTDNMQLNHDKWPNDKDHYSAGPVLTHYDSIYRVSNWLDGRIAKCDTIYNYSN